MLEKSRFELIASQIKQATCAEFVTDDFRQKLGSEFSWEVLEVTILEEGGGEDEWPNNLIVAAEEEVMAVIRSGVELFYIDFGLKVFECEIKGHKSLEFYQEILSGDAPF